MNPEELEEQKIYTIGQVSRLLDVKEHTLRFWEKEFPMIVPIRSASGRRGYSRQDFLLLQKIKKLLYEEGYTTKGALKELQTEIGQREYTPKINIQKDPSDLFYESVLDPEISEMKEGIAKKASSVAANNQKASQGLQSLKSRTSKMEEQLNDALWKQVYHNLSQVIRVLEDE